MLDFPEPLKPVNHSSFGRLMLQGAHVHRVDVERLPMHIARAAQGKVQHAGGDRGIADLVDEDERAQIAAFRIGLKYQRLVRGQIGDADGVETQGLRGQMFHGVDVDLVFRGCGWWR